MPIGRLLDGRDMTQPVMFKQSFLVAVLTAIQTLMPAAVAVLSLITTIRLLGSVYEPSSSALPLVAVLSLVLVRPPPELSGQLAASRVSVVIDIVFRWLLLLAALLAVGYATHSPLEFYPRRVFFTWAAGTPVALVIATLGMREIMRHFWLRALDSRRAVVAGYNESSLQLTRRLNGNPALHLTVTGFFDDRSSDRLAMAADALLLGGLGQLAAYINEHRVDVIFIALPMRHLPRVLSLLDDLRDTTASIYYVPDIFVFDLIQARSGEIEGIPVVAMCETPFYGYRGVAKRLTDFVLATVILTLLLPLLLAIAALVKLSSPGPVIFKQRRYGLDGQEIAVYKFRSMRVTEDGDKIRQASKRDARITPVGAFLRRSSLDELPQLINVLQGRMSLVGPRPHAVAHNEEYRKLIKGYMVRHKVLPGITGLAQVNGCRGETTELKDMQARVNYDLDYLRHWTPMLDIKIILLTAIKVFRDDKAY